METHPVNDGDPGPTFRNGLQLAELATVLPKVRDRKYAR